eukprot:PhF_6_TR29315/c0_g1_i1/m.43008
MDGLTSVVPGHGLHAFQVPHLYYIRQVEKLGSWRKHGRVLCCTRQGLSIAKIRGELKRFIPYTTLEKVTFQDTNPPVVICTVKGEHIECLQWPVKQQDDDAQELFRVLKIATPATELKRESPAKLNYVRPKEADKPQWYEVQRTLLAHFSYDHRNPIFETITKDDITSEKDKLLEELLPKKNSRPTFHDKSKFIDLAVQKADGLLSHALPVPEELFPKPVMENLPHVSPPRMPSLFKLGCDHTTSCYVPPSAIGSVLELESSLVKLRRLMNAMSGPASNAQSIQTAMLAMEKEVVGLKAVMRDAGYSIEKNDAEYGYGNYSHHYPTLEQAKQGVGEEVTRSQRISLDIAQKRQDNAVVCFTAPTPCWMYVLENEINPSVSPPQRTARRQYLWTCIADPCPLLCVASLKEIHDGHRGTLIPLPSIMSVSKTSGKEQYTTFHRTVSLVTLERLWCFAFESDEEQWSWFMYLQKVVNQFRSCARV